MSPSVQSRPFPLPLSPSAAALHYESKQSFPSSLFAEREGCGATHRVRLQVARIGPDAATAPSLGDAESDRVRDDPAEERNRQTEGGGGGGGRRLNRNPIGDKR